MEPPSLLALARTLIKHNLACLYGCVKNEVFGENNRKKRMLSVWHFWLRYFQVADVYMQTMHLKTKWVPVHFFVSPQFA